MRLDFFPSRSITLYLAKMFIVRILAVLVMLVLILQMLDLLSESGDILAYPGNGEAQLWTYVTLRVPQLVATFLPYSVLLATIITLATLNQNSEVISMKAAGMSAHQILAPLVLTALAVSTCSFAFNERVVTRATATLAAWSKQDYGPVPKNSDVRANVYLRDGDNVLLAGQLSGRDAAMRMDNVTWYRRNPEGMILQQVRAPSATYSKAGWLLADPVSFDVQSAQEKTIAPLLIASQLTPKRIALTGVDADSQSVVALYKSIERLEASGRNTTELRGAWWHKFSGPLSAILMPLLGAVAAFGLARSGHLFVRAVIGMALGFAYFVVDNAAMAMGNFGGYPPLLAAWAPFMLFLLVGELVLIRTEE